MKTAPEIIAHPKFAELRRARHGLAWPMAAAMLTAYFGFVWLMAFEPEWLGTPLTEGRSLTIGLPIGAGVILFAFIMTGVYAWAANRKFEALIEALRKDVE